MPVTSLPADQVLARLPQFDTIIDARTEDEFAEDHVPGAINWPTLDNAQRIEIGTMYKQVNAFEAKKRGAALSARNIAAHIEAHVLDLPKQWKPLVYCWRGGNRSGALATILGAIGFQVTLIEGGYKAWRQQVLLSLPALSQRLHYRVLCGPTGCGKTRLLQALNQAGAQTLDLEALANHRSSVLGMIPGLAQPSQKHFDTLIWDALRHMDPARPVYVESESKKVGNVRVPDALMDAMRQSPCVLVELSLAEREQLLAEDYAVFLQQPALFIERLQALVQRRGRETIDQWTEWVHAGQSLKVVSALLSEHYDPGYAESTSRNFVQFKQATPCVLANRHANSMLQAAQALVAQDTAAKA